MTGIFLILLFMMHDLNVNICAVILLTNELLSTHYRNITTTTIIILFSLNKE